MKIILVKICSNTIFNYICTTKNNFMEKIKNGTNYRNVYKSDHLGVVDLEEILERGNKLIFKIKEVKQEMGASVAGKKIDANIAYFEGNVKPLVLNSTNAQTLRKITGSAMIENWAGLLIELYIDPSVKMKGEVVGGVRIKPTIPVVTKPLFTEENFEKACKAGATIEVIKSRYDITEEMQIKYNEYVRATK